MLDIYIPSLGSLQTCSNIPIEEKRATAMSQHDDIEKTPPAAVYDEHRADQVDDIHVAALADDPEVARMPSLATIASIFVCHHPERGLAMFLPFAVPGLVDGGPYRMWLYRGNFNPGQYWYRSWEHI